MVVRVALTIIFLLVVAFAEATPGRAQGAGGEPDAAAWEIGPIIRGRNYSQGMPLQPTQGPRGSWYIDLPRAPGSVHYVTFRHGSLAGKRRIVMRYRIEADPGVRMLASEAPASPSLLTLFFQRGGDNWSARGRFEAYRWYASFASRPVAPGVHEIVVPLDGNWTAVMNSSAQTNPRGFRDALVETDRVGFVLGSREGLGHGVHATGRARLVVTEFRVE